MTRTGGALSDGDRRELRSVYRTNVSAVYAFFGYSVDAQTAEDLTAATFERVVRAWHRFDGDRASVQIWVLAIARNILRDHFRRQRFRAGPSLDEHPALAANLVDRQDEMSFSLGVEAMKAWLDQLKPLERDVLALRYGADLSCEDIAELLNLTRANVHQLSSRALRRLRAGASGADVSGRVARVAASVPTGT